MPLTRNNKEKLCNETHTPETKTAPSSIKQTPRQTQKTLVAGEKSTQKSFSWTDFDERITKLTDDIVKRITTEVNLLKNDLKQRIDIIEENLSSHVTLMDKYVKDLQSKQQQFEVRLNGLENNHHLLRTRMDNMEKHLDDLDSFGTELYDLRKSVDVYERREIASDAIIFGIPELKNENLKTTFNYICHRIDVQPPTVKAIFRPRSQQQNQMSRSRGTASSSPIVIKFLSPRDRNTVLHAVSEFCKNNKRQLCVEDADIQTTKNSNIHIFGSLTRKNRFYFQRATQYKRNGKLFAVFIRSGNIYVKESTNAEPILIESDLIMNTLAARCQSDATTNQHES